MAGTDFDRSGHLRRVEEDAEELALVDVERDVLCSWRVRKPSSAASSS
jgi:hypothetical protein